MQRFKRAGVGEGKQVQQGDRGHGSKLARKKGRGKRAGVGAESEQAKVRCLYPKLN